MRESVVPSATGNTRTLLHCCYTRLHTLLLLLVRFVFHSPWPPPPSKHQHTQRQHARLFQSSARPYYSISVHIHTLTQPLLPDRADSAYFHRASIAVRLSHCRPVATPLPTLQAHACSHQISTPAASREHMAWTAHLSSSPTSSSKHHASLTSTRANDPLMICAAYRTLLQQSIH